MATFNLQRITADDAEREDPARRIFGPEYEERQAQLRAKTHIALDKDKYRPWTKPTTERKKDG